jgi:large subunit ribosomal protein L15
MILDQLRPAAGSKKKRKRLGRGESSGHGGTSTKGHKGQKARAGASKGKGFEGGQMPLARRLPKRGFFNPFREVFAVVNLSQLAGFAAGSEVTPQLLRERRLVRRADRKVKILAKGECKVALTVKANAFSKKAAELIAKAGGKAEVI